MAAEIALVTERRYEQRSSELTAYEENIFEEDRLLIDALKARGVKAVRLDWSRPDADWEAYDAVVLRTPWDYFDRFQPFMAWLDRLAGHRCVLNDVDTLRWNIDKHYLAELADAGVPVVPTVFVEQGTRTSLSDAIEELGAQNVVIKPVVSGAARETYKVTADNRDRHSATFERLCAERAMMVQPFMPGIVEHGEVTVVAMGGKATHALVKRAKAGDFRVQDDHGGTVHAHDAAGDELELAQAALSIRERAPVYGRVDMVRDPDGVARVMELELIEPELWLRLHPPAAVAFAEGIVAALG